MERDDALPDEVAAAFEVTAEDKIAETPIARIWRVRDRAGDLRAVKLWADGGRANEGPGVALMRAWSGRGAVEIFAEQPHAILTDWLPGPSLADVARGGSDLDAARSLGAVASRLHAGPVKVAGLTALPDWFAALRNAPDKGGDGRLIGQAQEVLRALLATAPPPVALHGDLHHGNVAKGLQGFVAFDAKGLIGDPAYELANAFVHPSGSDVARHDRIEALAALWSSALMVDQTRLLRWAFAKAALSLVWAAQRRKDDPARRRLLESLWDLLQR